jgi:hypothetical protein
MPSIIESASDPLLDTKSFHQGVTIAREFTLFPAPHRVGRSRGPKEIGAAAK